MPAPYWPRTASSGSTVFIDLNTSTLRDRTSSAPNDTGGSMAHMATSWNTWFGTMSRSAPVAS